MMQTTGELFLAGPTAVGKTTIALLLAQRVNAEIISVDSMQVYRGLNIGTAKPRPDEQNKVKHHLIDIADITEHFDAARFLTLSKAASEEIQGRGKKALFCGGTGLYFRTYFHGLGEAPPGDELLRAELEKVKTADLLSEIENKDPELFAKIDKQNRRRLIRAVEVMRLTGKPYSAQRASWKDPKFPLLVLSRNREELCNRIETRVESMFRNGLVVEVKELLERGLKDNPTAYQAIGYKEVIDHLEGRLSLKECRELVKVRTRQYAKRQVTWFKQEKSATWITIEKKESDESVVDRIMETTKAPATSSNN